MPKDNLTVTDYFHAGRLIIEVVVEDALRRRYKIDDALLTNVLLQTKSALSN